MSSITLWNEWMDKKLVMLIMQNNWAVYIFGIDKKYDKDIDEAFGSLDEECGTTMDSISELFKYSNDYLLVNHKFDDEFGYTKEKIEVTKPIKSFKKSDSVKVKPLSKQKSVNSSTLEKLKKKVIDSKSSVVKPKVTGKNTKIQKSITKSVEVKEFKF